jgi:hypothetical protein
MSLYRKVAQNVAQPMLHQKNAQRKQPTKLGENLPNLAAPSLARATLKQMLSGERPRESVPYNSYLKR